MVSNGLYVLYDAHKLQDMFEKTMKDPDVVSSNESKRVQVHQASRYIVGQGDEQFEGQSDTRDFIIAMIRTSRSNIGQQYKVRSVAERAPRSKDMDQ